MPRADYLYLLVRSPFDGRAKIGRSFDPHERALNISNACGDRIVVYASVACGGKSVAAERAMHEAYRNYRLSGEWFAFDPEDLAFLSDELSRACNIATWLHEHDPDGTDTEYAAAAWVVGIKLRASRAQRAATKRAVVDAGVVRCSRPTSPFAHVPPVLG